MELFTVCSHAVRATRHIPSSKRQKPPPQGSPGNTAPPPPRESPQGRPRPLPRPWRTFLSHPLPRMSTGQTPLPGADWAASLHPPDDTPLPPRPPPFTPAGGLTDLTRWTTRLPRGLGSGPMWGRRRRWSTGAEVGARAEVGRGNAPSVGSEVQWVREALSNDDKLLGHSGQGIPGMLIPWVWAEA